MDAGIEPLAGDSNRQQTQKEHLAIRRTFSLVDMITNTKFSNCPNVFEIGVVWQLNMHSRQQNMFQSDSPFTISCKRALSTPPLI